MVYVSLANRILFWVGGSVAERASELQAGQLQRAACSRLLGQLNPLICQWVISGTRLGKATDSTGYTETTHIIRTKLHQMDSSKQTVDVHASDVKAEVTTTSGILRGPSLLQVHLRSKRIFNRRKCERGCALFKQLQRQCILGALMAAGFARGGTYLHQGSHTDPHTHEKHFKHADTHTHTHSGQSELSSAKTINSE